MELFIMRKELVVAEGAQINFEQLMSEKVK